jgi:hypothetical protein
MANLDPRIEEIRVKFGLKSDDFWELPQRKGTWIAKHAALEVAAVKAGITFDTPQILEAYGEQGVVALSVVGKMDNRVEWSIGETNSSNYKTSGKQPSYPWAMAEKRAKDRVILKLIGIHGLVYSEDEGDFKMTKATARAPFAELQEDLRGCNDMSELRQFWADASTQAKVKSLPDDWREQINKEKDELKALFERDSEAA